MRYKDPKLMQDIVDFVNKYYEENYRCPSSRTIAAAVGSNMVYKSHGLQS